MPSNWLHVDTNFPSFSGEESVNDKVTTIQNYMFMLVEQLRYTLFNLDLTNMNKTAVERFTGSITEPIYGRIENAEGDITELSATAHGLALRISNAEGNITALTVTAQGLTARISSAEGSITSLAVTAQGLQTQVTNHSGQISSLTQTVYGFELSVSNGAESSRLYLTSGGINFGSAEISFSGMVTFSDLSTPGKTTISGGNVTSGTITGATLKSVSGYSQVWIANGGVNIYDGAGSSAGGLFYNSNGAGTPEEAKNRVFFHTSPGNALKIQSGADMSIHAPYGTIYAMGVWDFRSAYCIWE